MHMVMTIIGGAVSLAVFLLFGWLWGGNAGAMATAAKLFVVVWLAIAATNMWVGVAKAGYRIQDESVIFLVVFGLPVAGAVLAIWRLSRP